MSEALPLEWLDGPPLAVCRLEPDAAVPEWATTPQDFITITRSEHELSIVARDDLVPDNARAERGWGALRVQGTLDFSIVGLLARLTSALADADISVFAISTYDTDYILVRLSDRVRAELALRDAGVW